MRIVSLVPSLTETIVAFGKLEDLVGRTRYCSEPAGTIEAVEAVGGTKNPDVARIVDIHPDLVIVNKEENRLEDVEELRAAGLSIHVTHPRSVREAVEMLETLGEAVGAADQGAGLARACREALEDCAGLSDGRRPPRTFCPIWRRPWMTFHSRTYIGDVLRETGFANVFGDHEGDDFFEVGLEEVAAEEPELLLLPDEPYVFSEEHGRELNAAGVSGAVVCVDGKLLAWYGPRLPSAIRELAAISNRGVSLAH